MAPCGAVAHCNFLQDSAGPRPQTARCFLNSPRGKVSIVLQMFLWVATAHFLALLSPGPDFFLVVRTGLAGGWRPAFWTSLGIAAANGVFIALALGGLSLLQPDSPLFRLLQAAGGLYLLYLGWMSWRHAGASTLETPATPTNARPAPRQARTCFWPGLWSGLLNPKNALFYASLAALLGPGVSVGWKWLTGLWMVLAVLGWDTLVGSALGHATVRRRFARALPGLERACGAALATSGAAVCIAAGWRR